MREGLGKGKKQMRRRTNNQKQQRDRRRRHLIFQSSESTYLVVGPPAYVGRIWLKLAAIWGLVMQGRDAREGPKYLVIIPILNH
jgi:hypothetical protein